MPNVREFVQRIECMGINRGNECKAPFRTVGYNERLNFIKPRLVIIGSVCFKRYVCMVL
uniref:Uncharacterized protein n=1 Tax=Anopheles atroparvus TaxID=41427 RepID=A0AAG5D216_ANOAO